MCTPKGQNTLYRTLNHTNKELKCNENGDAMLCIDF